MLHEPGGGGGFSVPTHDRAGPATTDIAEASPPGAPTNLASRVANLGITGPAPARVINALFGGYHNFTVDRVLAEDMTRLWPDYRFVLWAQKAFENRVVEWLTARGIEQFIDIGCGLPVIASVHSIAPATRIVYVDLDPVVVTVARHMLTDDPYAEVIQGDLRQPASVLEHPTVQTHIDLSRPVAVLLSGVLPHIADGDDPADILTQIRTALRSGSYLAVSHIAPVATLRSEQEHVRRLYEQARTPWCLRTPRQISALLAAWELVEPGLVPVTDWRPQPNLNPHPTPKTSLYGAVARAS